MSHKSEEAGAELGGEEPQPVAEGRTQVQGPASRGGSPSAADSRDHGIKPSERAKREVESRK